MAQWKGRLGKKQRSIDSSSEYEAAQVAIDVANRIHDILVNQGMTQKQLASAMGVSDAYVSQLLSGDANPTISTLVRVTRALGSEMKTLFENEESSRPSEVLTEPAEQKQRVFLVEHEAYWGWFVQGTSENAATAAPDDAPIEDTSVKEIGSAHPPGTIDKSITV